MDSGFTSMNAQLGVGFKDVVTAIKTIAPTPQPTQDAPSPSSSPWIPVLQAVAFFNKRQQLFENGKWVNTKPIVLETQEDK
jgi:hypothetical protein